MPTLSSHCLTALAVNSGPLLLPLYIWEHHAGQTSHSNAVVHFRYWDPFPHQWPGTHVYTHLLMWVYVRFGHHVFLFVQNHSSKRGFCRPALTEYSCHHSATIFFFWVVCSVSEALLVAKDVQFASGSHPSLPVVTVQWYGDSRSDPIVSLDASYHGLIVVGHPAHAVDVAACFVIAQGFDTPAAPILFLDPEYHVRTVLLVYVWPGLEVSRGSPFKDRFIQFSFCQ